jgi:hypothetical protein
MKSIPLTKGYIALVDDEDFSAVNAFKWHAQVAANNVYARRSIRKKGKIVHIYLHRFLLGIEDTPEIKVDHHPDPNGLNCQRHNLRIATQTQNTRNQRRRYDNSSGFKGVSWLESRKRYQVSIRVNGESKFLGLFVTAQEGAKAYDIAALKYHGEFAQTNANLGLLGEI